MLECNGRIGDDKDNHESNDHVNSPNPYSVNDRFASGARAAATAVFCGRDLAITLSGTQEPGKAP
jgi:hypothetical protein